MQRLAENALKSASIEREQLSPSVSTAVGVLTSGYNQCMDGGPIRFDVEELQRSLASVDHVLIRLTPIITQRLLIDFRSNEHAGPAAIILPDVDSFAERLKSIERARPDFEQPERLNVIIWPLRVGALERLGVIGAIRDRFAALDAIDALRDIDEVYERLLKLEQEEQMRAIVGDGYRTLWPREPQQA